MKVNGKDYPMYYGKYKMFETTNQTMWNTNENMKVIIVPKLTSENRCNFLRKNNLSSPDCGGRVYIGLWLIKLHGINETPGHPTTMNGIPN